MNFCKMYNKIVNFAEKLDHKYIEEYDNARMERTKRDNVSQVNIIYGSFVLFFIIFICFPLFGMFYSMALFGKMTTSKCELNNDAEKEGSDR